MEFIGLDIGTTGAKALLADERGRVLGKGYAGYGLISDGPRIEQRAGDWIEGGAKAVRQALEGRDPSRVAAVAVSAQGASTAAFDAGGRPIGNAITWMDARAGAEAAELAEALGGEYIYRNTGWRINPALDAAKILYMKRSGKYPGAKHFYSTAEYVNLFLAGNPVCDPTCAAIRQLYNVPGGCYDERILRAAGILTGELPEVLPAGALIGAVTPDAAAATGLPAGTPVYNGAHDQYCASIGAAAVESGDLLLSAGTTWVVMGISGAPLFTDTFIAPAAHPVDGLYGAIASLVGCGSSLQWFGDNFAGGNLDEIGETAAARLEKTSGLFFYPYTSGAAYPIWNLDMRGAFTGISLEHDKYDFARVIMESSAFSLRRALEDFAGNGFRAGKLLVMGGAAKSGLWLGMIAAAAAAAATATAAAGPNAAAGPATAAAAVASTVTAAAGPGISVEACGESEACALGAAIIAAKGCGAYADFREAAAAMTPRARPIPRDAGLAAAMDEKYARYNRMWSCVAGYYDKIEK